jgi:hypothetical protein
MNRFKCPQCNGNQFSTNSNENTPCIYCGNPTVKKMDTLDEVPGERIGDVNEDTKANKDRR